MKETRIGVISDTHYTNHNRQYFPLEPVAKAFKDVELIIHAGDIVHLSLLDMLRGIAPVEAVCGTMDDVEASSRLVKRKTLEIAGTLIGIAHGFGSHDGFPSKISKYFEGEQLDAIVFGHTHVPYNEVIGGVLYFNPGSPVKPALPNGPTVGILTITQPHKITGTIINLF